MACQLSLLPASDHQCLQYKHMSLTCKYSVLSCTHREEGIMKERGIVMLVLVRCIGEVLTQTKNGERR